MSEPSGPPVITTLTIKGYDGTDLLTFTFKDGHLDVAGDESRWTEAATRFVAEVRRMLVGGPSKIRLCQVCNDRCVGQWLP